MSLKDPLALNFSPIREKKNGRSPDFRDGFWLKFSDPQAYNTHKRRISTDTSQLLDYQDNQQVYAEIKIDYLSKSASKSSFPMKVWEEAGIKVIGTTDETTVVTTGKPSSFRKLNQIINSASFEKAKNLNILKQDRNLSREIYAISSVTNRTESLEGRLSSSLYELVGSGHSELIDCTIELSPTVPIFKINEYQNKLAQYLSKEVRSIPEDRIIHNIIYYAELFINEITQILENSEFSDVQIIRSRKRFLAQRLVPSTNLDDVRVLQAETNQIVGIIDSGIAHPLISPLEFMVENFISNSKTAEMTHGTMVASRILFGENLFQKVESGSLTPLCQYIDVRLLFKDEEFTRYEEEDLKRAIVEVFRRYPQVHVYNLSSNEFNGLQISDFNNPVHRLTEYLDTKAREFDKLLIVSSGNHVSYPSFKNDYSKIYESAAGDVFVAPPGDGLNTLTVSSITQTASSDFISKKEKELSPFARRGKIRANWQKPELTHFGGNVLFAPNDHDYNDPTFQISSRNRGGVEMISGSGLVKNYGTSFSTPLVTREAVIVQDKLEKSGASEHLNLNKNRANLTKAVLIHSTLLNTQTLLEEETRQKGYVGFGIPKGELCFEDNSNQATIFHCETISDDYKKNKIHITLPVSMIGKNCRAILTLVYNPPVNSNYPSEYNSTMMSANVRILNDFAENLPRTNKPKPKQFKKVQQLSYQQNNFPVIQLVFEDELRSNKMEILTQLTTRLYHEKETLGRHVEQDYALVLSITDLEESGTLKQELIESSQFIELDIDNEIEVSS